MQQTETMLFEKIRQRFHDLRSILSSVPASIELIETDSVGTLSRTQSSLLSSMNETIKNLIDSFDTVGQEVMQGLAPSPTSGPIYLLPCRHNETLQGEHIIAGLERVQKLLIKPVSLNVIVVAETKWLVQFKRILGNANHQYRLASDPADVSYLSQTDPADVILMLTPDDLSVKWWMTLRLLLDRTSPYPMIFNLVSNTLVPLVHG